MKPERTISSGVRSLGWAKHKRNSEEGKRYYRKVRRKVKQEIKQMMPK